MKRNTSPHRPLWRFLFVAVLWLSLLGAAVAGLSVAVLYPSLPDLKTLTDYQPKQPLRIYTEDKVLIGEFGEERRHVVRLKDTPMALRRAILAAEDDRFYEHGGIDMLGVLRAAGANLVSGGARQGASTITMQVARNFFLGSEKTMSRKLKEAMLSYKIEKELSKDEILELYINQIYLGQRAYGFAAAAQIYFGKPLANINLAEAAMLAGLPKAPSSYNPVANFPRAKVRQGYVLGRMRDLGWISGAEYDEAIAKKLVVRNLPQAFDGGADHLAEMARSYMFQRYGESIYVSGMKVYTTVRIADQRAAADAVRAGLVAYNRRKRYIGPEAYVSLPASQEKRVAVIADALSAHPEVNGLVPAVVLKLTPKGMRVQLPQGEEVELGASELAFAKTAEAGKGLKPGAVVRVVRLSAGAPWQLTMLPHVEGALVSLSPADGAIRAMVGGFAFSRNQYNHTVQALRQPGSAFKPFIYSAALEKGITPATVFDDAPLRVDPALTGGVVWNPENYDKEFGGSMTLRRALTLSKNLVSIRVLLRTTPEFARQHAARFGFDPERIQPYPTMALGVNEVSPLELAAGYAVFANGGQRVHPYYLLRVTDKDGRVLENYTAPEPVPALDPRNAFIMTTMMQDVIRHGTAAKAMDLGRLDLAGKTGTTNDYKDTWFAGFGPTRVAVAWIGYDTPRTTGETGATGALPIWMHYMGRALQGVPEVTYAPPEGVIVVPQADGRSEYFMMEYAPKGPNE